MTCNESCPTEMRRMMQHMTVVVSNHCKMVDWVGLLTGPTIEEFKNHIRQVWISHTGGGGGGGWG